MIIKWPLAIARGHYNKGYIMKAIIYSLMSIGLIIYGYKLRSESPSFGNMSIVAGELCGVAGLALASEDLIKAIKK